MNPALLDTDNLTLFHKRHPQVVINAALYLSRYGQLTFSEFGYYEVTGGLKAIGATRQLASFEQFCRTQRILPFSHSAAILSADIWADHKQRGLLIGEVDILNAAIALDAGLEVVTHNTSHFSRIAGLALTDWTV
jgi:tRNA(fMet)-specific endonuclease VapC